MAKLFKNLYQSVVAFIRESGDRTESHFKNRIVPTDSIFKQLKIIMHEIPNFGRDSIEIEPQKLISVIQVGTKKELLDLIHAVPFGLIIFPSYISYETSIALLKEIRQIRSDINLKIVILLSAFNHQHLVSLLKYKVNGYLVAPITEEKIKQFLLNPQHFFVKD